ncbi:MAG: hypothetical protein LBL34_00915 [Clostridiales bacterium]|nr:hypothetical protein [Clostridiales bacterium]
MKDKNLLERLGIIQKEDAIDEVNEKNSATAAAESKTTVATAPETKEEFVLHFSPNTDTVEAEKESISNVVSKTTKTVKPKPKAKPAAPSSVEADLPEKNIFEELASKKPQKSATTVKNYYKPTDSAAEVAASPYVNLSAELGSSSISDAGLKLKKMQREVSTVQKLSEIAAAVEVEYQNVIEPEEIQLPVIDREAIYAKYRQEMAAEESKPKKGKNDNIEVQYEADDTDVLPVVEQTVQDEFNTEKYNSIGDLYKAYGKTLSGTDTIFVVDAFSKSLPDTLSINLKRQSVLNIMKVSNINVEELVADGLSRIDNINNFLTAFKEKTEQVVNSKEAQISQLEQQISVLKREVKERTRLQEKQEAAIDFEIHKIRAALDFVANNDENGA